MKLPLWLQSARAQTSLLLLGSLGTVLSASMLFIGYTLNQSFADLEARETTQHIERVAEIISNELGFLGKRIGDWGDWDDAADYFLTKSRKFEEANLEVSVLESMNLSSIRFYQLDGTFQGGIERQPPYDHPSLKTIIDKHLPEHPELWPAQDDFGMKSGIVKLDSNLFIYASKNVRRTNRAGPAMGRLIFMRLLDREFPTLISVLSKLPVAMSPVSDGTKVKQSGAITVKLPTLLAIDEASYELSSLELTHSSIWAYDSRKVPVLRFDFSLPRALIAQGRDTMRSILLAFGVSIGITLLIQTWGMQKILLRKLLKLCNEVSLLAIREPKQRKVSVSGQTEVRDLAIKINEMLEELQSRQEVSERQTQQIYQLQMQQALLQEQETSEKSLRMASELRFHLAGMLAHRINNPLNFTQLSLMNSKDLIKTLEQSFSRLFAASTEDDPDMLLFRRELEGLFQQLSELQAIMEKGLKKSAESIHEIRLLSGVDGAKLEKLSSKDLLQILNDVFEDLSLDQWSKRLAILDSQPSDWQIEFDRSILKNSLEMLITVCLQNSELPLKLSLQGDAAENWYFLLETKCAWDASSRSALERSLRHLLGTCKGDLDLSFHEDFVKARFYTQAS